MTSCSGHILAFVVLALARICLRHWLVGKVVTAFIGKSFLPKGEAALRRFVYRCGERA